MFYFVFSVFYLCEVFVCGDFLLRSLLVGLVFDIFKEVLGVFVGGVFKINYYW